MDADNTPDNKDDIVKFFPFLLSTVLMSTSASSALAQDQDTGEYSTVQECRGIKRDSTRVACYDAIVDGGVFTIEVRRKAERRAIGKSQLKSDDGSVRDEPEKVVVEIVEVKKLPNRRLQFRTADGQIWRQRSSDHMAPERTPFPAEIRQGAFGSYGLTSLKWPKLIKVERIK